MSGRRASVGAVTLCLALLLVVVLAGCGSSDPAGDHSAAGVNAAAREFLADVTARRYSQACEVMTSAALAELNRQQGQCPGATEYYDLALHGQLGNWFQRVLPNLQVNGDAAEFEGRVEARYERGRWRLESSVW
jgi:hypothetical protein